MPARHSHAAAAPACSDMLALVVRLLSGNERVLARVRRQHTHICVDEMQVPPGVQTEACRACSSCCWLLAVPA